MKKPYWSIKHQNFVTQLEVCDVSDKGPKKKCCKSYKKKKKKGKFCKRCPKILIN